MADDTQPERTSILSVAQKWLPWCLALIFILTIGWTALIARSEIESGKHSSISETAIAVVSLSAPAQPMIIVYSLFIVTLLDVTGGLIVVTARYLGDKFLKPLREKIRAEGKAEGVAQGKAEGLTEGLEQGKAEEHRLWAAWNRRREHAEANNLPFDEPPPSL